MKQQISIFEDARFGQIRTATTEGGEPLFCLADVCKALALQTNKVKGRLSERGWSTIPTPTHNQHGAVVEQSMTYITEPNLYKCIFQSRKATAEQFQEWVCSEVLPSIRRQGGYMVAKPDETPEQVMARALMIAQATLERRDEQLKALTAENLALAPKARYADEVLQSASNLTFTEVAKELGYRSAKAFLDRLVASRVLYRQSGRYLPMAKYSDKGYFATRTHRFYHSDGRPDASVMTVVTQRGRAFLNANYGNAAEVGRA